MIKLTNWKTVLELAETINKDAEGIYNEVEQLEVELNKLRSTFLDDGFQEVENQVKMIKTIIEANFGNLTIISEELMKYAELLAQTH